LNKTSFIADVKRLTNDCMDAGGRAMQEQLPRGYRFP